MSGFPVAIWGNDPLGPQLLAVLGFATRPGIT